MQVLNRFTGKVIYETEKENLSNADLSNADLRGVDLRGANLYGANLCGADLRWADLSEAKYKDSIIHKYFTITRIGTRLDSLQVYILESEVILKTGCFIGSPEELTGQLQLDKIEHQEYLIALDQIDAMAKLYQGGEPT